MSENNPLLSDQKKKKYIKILRIINIAIAVLILVISIVAFLFVILDVIISFRFFLIFSPAYMIIFSLLLLGSEFRWRFVLKKMPFLRTPLGRGLLYLYLSSIVYYYFSAISQQVLGYVCGFVLMFTSFLYLAIHFGYAKGITTEDLQEQYEDSYRERLV